MKTFDLNETEATVIESMRVNGASKRKRLLTRDVQIAVAPTYFAEPQHTICEVLKNRIVDNGFIAPDLSQVGSSDQGSANFDLCGCYLTITWYLMQSGNYEIIAYVS